jgi:hypothetical protein
MPLTVLENAYLRKAEEISTFNETHKKLLLFLIHEKKYFQKDELLCFANYCENELDKTIKQLEKCGLLKVEGWLVRFNEQQKLEETIIEELRDKIPLKIKK